MFDIIKNNSELNIKKKMIINKKIKRKKIINKNIKNNNYKNINNNDAPYILTISKIIENENLINDKEARLFSSKEFSELSGSESDYDPKKWNNIFKIKNTHNCYSYALGKIVPGLKSKAQPGYSSAYNHISDNDYNCKEFYGRLKKDSPGTYLENFDNACVPGFYKIFLALDPMNDYHWYKQDSNSFWSHKPGSTSVTDVDASKKKIKNPLLSDRNFKSLNYYKPCFFACIYSDLSRSLDNIYKMA